MKKFLFVIVCLMFVITTACSNNPSTNNSSQSSGNSQSNSNSQSQSQDNSDAMIDKSDEIMDTLSFRDTMSILSDDAVANFYELDESILKNMVVYKGATGATAEEIAIFELNDAKDAEQMIKICETRLQDLKVQYENYKPEEMTIIDDGVIEVNGNLVMLAVCDDVDTAKDLFLK